jgi:ABC-type polysaccharide/polyol phosphate export permease
VLTSLRRLARYRALISSLVARELTARYRGSVLGFLWTFVNPLLLLLVYTFVFGVVMPGVRAPGIEPYSLFLFCGLLPWTWFSSALLESCTALTGSGGLLRKVMFPAEVLPLVAVLTGLVNFLLGLCIVVAFAIYAGAPVFTADLAWLVPTIVVQLVLTVGLALLLSSLSVHFRDIRDLLSHALTLWLFATPIIYPYTQAPERYRWLLDLNPFTHLAIAYQAILFSPEPYTQIRRLAWVGLASVAILVTGYVVFDRLRETFPEEV